MRRNEFAELVYGKSRKIAVRQGRRWGCVDPAAQEDVAGDAYLAAARKALAKLDGGEIESPDGLAATIAYRATSNVLRDHASRQGRFEESFLRLDDPDAERRIDPSDEGAAMERAIEALDGEEPMPEWRRQTRATYARLPPELRRIARELLRTGHPEEAAQRLRIPRTTFYRRLRNLRKIFRPCFIGLKRHRRR